MIFIHSTILESENCRTVDTMRRRNETKRDDMIIDMQCSIAIHLMYIYTYNWHLHMYWRFPTHSASQKQGIQQRTYVALPHGATVARLLELVRS